MADEYDTLQTILRKLVEMQNEATEGRAEMRDGFASVRGEVDGLRDDVRAIRATQAEHGTRLSRLGVGVAGLIRDRASDVEAGAEQAVRIDGFDARLARIERRLQLRD